MGRGPLNGYLYNQHNVNAGCRINTFHCHESQRDCAEAAGLAWLLTNLLLEEEVNVKALSIPSVRIWALG